MNQIYDLKDRNLLQSILKAELKDGGYYVGRTNQRGMPIGMWDDKKGRFICIKPPKFGQHSIYEMNHIEDDDGFVCFEPVIKIEI
jgi:hypothetical protein